MSNENTSKHPTLDKHAGSIQAIKYLAQIFLGPWALGIIFPPLAPFYWYIALLIFLFA